MKPRTIIFNTSVITNYGIFEYRPITLDEAKRIVVEAGDSLISAVGHKETAAVISDIFGISIKANRINLVQKVDDIVVVFKLKKRAPEGVILSREEVEKIGYEFGLLKLLEEKRIKK